MTPSLVLSCSCCTSLSNLLNGFMTITTSADGIVRAVRDPFLRPAIVLACWPQTRHRRHMVHYITLISQYCLTHPHDLLITPFDSDSGPLTGTNVCTPPPGSASLRPPPLSSRCFSGQPPAPGNRNLAQTHIPY